MNHPEEVVPRPLVAREFNVCSRSIRRWQQAKIPGFDEPVTINGRVFHRRSKIEQAKRGTNHVSKFNGPARPGMEAG